MANKALFQSIAGRLPPAADARNEAGGAAYHLSPRGALAQYAATGCLNATYYASAEEQLERVLALASAVPPEFVARTAVFARERGYMKDMPALLLALLSVRSPELFARVFDRVITDGRMLRTLVQVLRSGAVGRRSLGSLPKRLVRRWLAARDDEAVLRASVGNDPSLVDVLRLVHPAPATEERRALYGYLLRRPHDAAKLPPSVRALEAFRSGASAEVPDVPMQLLTSLPLTGREWAVVARRASWQTLRMNLATFARQGVFDEPGMAAAVAARLRDAGEIRRARVFPYQLMAAWAMARDLPLVVRDALAEAMEIATANVPAIDGKVFVLPDVSGSMSSPVTGFRRGATTSVRCIDVAALIAASLLRKNPEAEVLPFAVGVERVRLDPRDTVTTNAARLASIGGGGTNCGAPLAELNARRARGDLVIYVSDSESWMDRCPGSSTETMRQWSAFRARNPEARLVCIDLQAYGTSQARDADDVLNVGGFSDQVFDVIAAFRSGTLGGDHWARRIEEEVALD